MRAEEILKRYQNGDRLFAEVDLTGVHLTRADLTGADLRGANLSDANLSDANLSGANLTGANLTGARLTGAHLSEAHLYGANLSGANLTGANLSGANLSGANLYGANLYGANLYKVDLTGADLTEAKYTKTPTERTKGVSMTQGQEAAQQDDHSSENQARTQVAYIVELFEAYSALEDGAETVTVDGEAHDDAEAVIELAQENALSTEVRSDWESNPDDLTPTEYKIVVCTGGPHVELQGRLDAYHQPKSPRVLHKDWGTSGEYFAEAAEREALAWYVSQFYFGD